MHEGHVVKMPLKLKKKTTHNFELDLEHNLGENQLGVHYVQISLKCDHHSKRRNNSCELWGGYMA